VAQLPGTADPDEVKRVRAKYLAIKRAEWRLRQRLETIDHEFDVVKPGLQALEQKITVLGELPTFTVAADDETADDEADADGDRKN
jgi:hypothetical protein